MAFPTSTFATLRALHLVIADGLDDIQRIFSQTTLQDPPASPASQFSSPANPSSPLFSPSTSPFPATPPASFPPTPLSTTFPSHPHTDTGIPFVDYPSPDLPFLPDSPSEQLALHPDAVAAATRIVAACGQMSNIVHKPFLSLCDAIMSYILPACMRLVEHLHVAEIIREAEENRQCCPATGQTIDTVDVRAPFPGSDPKESSRVHEGIEGLHVTDIMNVICSYAGTNYVDPNNLVHALRLLSTHHIFRETAPDTFALNRVASLLDSGKSVKAVFSDPDTKYDDTGGTAAFVALTTDELFKSAAYLTEAFTGVQLSTRGAILSPSFLTDAVFPSTTTIPSASSYVVNDPVACPPTTRSSSILTHIVHPDDEDVPIPLHSFPTDSPGNVKLYPPLMGVLVPSKLPETGSSPPPHLTLVEPSVQVEHSVHYGNVAKHETFLAFNLAFRTHAPYFEWLEAGGEDLLGGMGQGASIRPPHALPRRASAVGDDMRLAGHSDRPNCVPQKSHRLRRFSNAMKGSIAWEAPKAILSGFDWYSLPQGSTVVDVGGGIGSTTMVLARALNDLRLHSIKKQDGTLNEGLQPASTATQKSQIFNYPSLVASDEVQNNSAPQNGLNIRFVVQDRPVVTGLGVETWRSKCPDMLERGQVIFQDQNFFEPQLPLEPPHITRHPSVYLLRVVLHDWPDEVARRILINLRVASNPETRLVIAEHVLPLACVDEDLDHVNTKGVESGTEDWTLNSTLANIEGAERTLVSPPLLANLGKASANAYWMDLIMHISLNGKERTLREFCALTLSAGWRITRMTRPEGLLFAYLVCEPITLPDDAQAIYNAVVLSSELSAVVAVPSDAAHHSHVDPSRHKRLPPRPVSLLPSPMLERSTSRCGTPTFGSRTLLPKDEELQSPRSRGFGVPKKWFKSRGLGVRSAMMQRIEKQREEQNTVKGAPAQDNGNVQSPVPTSSSHIRVWWKKTPPSSTRNSTTAAHELSNDMSDHRIAGRRRRGALKSGDSPSTPSPRISPVHQHWPSTESAALPAPEVSPPVAQARRPSVASITRRLSFGTFGRRPSIPDITEPLPTPPPSATLTDLAPPPTLPGDTGRSLKHLPSLPMFGRSEITMGATTGPSAIPRRPSLSFVGQAPVVQSAAKSSRPRRPDIAGSPKSGILKPRVSPNTSSLGSMADSTSIPRRQRRVTVSNSPGPLSRTLLWSPDAIGVSVPPDPVPEVRRVPSVPKLPRRLSIPMLRRKQSQTVVRDAEKKS